MNWKAISLPSARNALESHKKCAIVTMFYIVFLIKITLKFKHTFLSISHKTATAGTSMHQTKNTYGVTEAIQEFTKVSAHAKLLYNLY